MPLKHLKSDEGIFQYSISVWICCRWIALLQVSKHYKHKDPVCKRWKCVDWNRLGSWDLNWPWLELSRYLTVYLSHAHEPRFWYLLVCFSKTSDEHQSFFLWDPPPPLPHKDPSAVMSLAHDLLLSLILRLIETERFLSVLLIYGTLFPLK